MLEHGAKINSVDKHNATPLYYAAQLDNEDVVWALVKEGASNKYVSDEEMTASEVADEEDYGRIVKIIEKYAKK